MGINRWGSALHSVLAASLVAMPVTTFAQDLKPQPDYSGSYLCTPIDISGFHFDESASEWKSVIFDKNGIQHVIKVKKTVTQDPVDKTKPQYTTYTIGKKRLGLQDFTPCMQSHLNGEVDGRIRLYTSQASCSAPSVGDFRMDMETLRYQIIEDGGFMYDLRHLAPYIEIGRCTKID